MDIEQQIEAIKAAIREMIGQVDIDNLSDEQQGMIAQALDHASNRITELRQEQQGNQEEPQQQEPPPQPQTQPQFEASNAQQLLWILSGNNVDVFVNYLSTIPDPELNQLLRNPDQLDRVLHSLQSTMPKGELPVQDGIEQAGIQSSNIYGFRYDPKTKKLLVRFQGGPIYAYDGVPKNIMQIFQQGAIPAKSSGSNRYGMWWRGKKPSLGASFYELIKKGNYPYQRLR